MTVEEALEEARRRWGQDACLSNGRDDDPAWCLVGVLREGRFRVKGMGATWEAALASAEERQRESSPTELNLRGLKIVAEPRRTRPTPTPRKRR